MKTRDIIQPAEVPQALSKTTDNPNGLAHEQAQMDVAVAEVQEDLLELYKRFIELRDTYARLKMRRDQPQAAATKATHASAVSEARGRRRPGR